MSLKLMSLELVGGGSQLLLSGSGSQTPSAVVGSGKPRPCRKTSLEDLVGSNKSTFVAKDVNEINFSDRMQFKVFKCAAASPSSFITQLVHHVVAVN